jgi:hypothetical protein
VKDADKMIEEIMDLVRRHPEAQGSVSALATCALAAAVSHGLAAVAQAIMYHGSQTRPIGR